MVRTRPVLRRHRLPPDEHPRHPHRWDRLPPQAAPLVDPRAARPHPQAGRMPHDRNHSPSRPLRGGLPRCARGPVERRVARHRAAVRGDRGNHHRPCASRPVLPVPASRGWRRPRSGFHALRRHRAVLRVPVQGRQHHAGGPPGPWHRGGGQRRLRLCHHAGRGTGLRVRGGRHRVRRVPHAAGTAGASPGRARARPCGGRASRRRPSMARPRGVGARRATSRARPCLRRRARALRDGPRLRS